MTRDDVLKAAQKAVTEEREKQYGKPEKNFAKIAEYWTDYLRHAHGIYTDITMMDVAHMMILLKIARIHGKGTDDTYTDIAGYAALAAELVKYDEIMPDSEDGNVKTDAYKDMIV